MAKPTYEEVQKQSELIAELSDAVRAQIFGDMDWVRARTYWKTRLPELMSHSSELAEALACALNKAAVRRTDSAA